MSPISVWTGAATFTFRSVRFCLRSDGLVSESIRGVSTGPVVDLLISSQPTDTTDGGRGLDC